MRIAGLPVWALVLAACALVPFAIQAWTDVERRRAQARTRALLQRLGGLDAGAPELLDTAPSSAIASGARRAASTETPSSHDDPDDPSAPARAPDDP